LTQIWLVVKEPTIAELFLFLILQGICIPSFGSFDYYFATNYLGITNSMLSLMSASVFAMAFLPKIY
jgi:hypothetical protein